MHNAFPHKHSVFLRLACLPFHHAPILVTGTYDRGQLTHQLLTFPTHGLLGASTFGIFFAFPFVLLSRFELPSPP